jgi:hypothetical protein
MRIRRARAEGEGSGGERRGAEGSGGERRERSGAEGEEAPEGRASGYMLFPMARFSGRLKAHIAAPAASPRTVRKPKNCSFGQRV